MRTTVDLEEDVLDAARSLARASGRSLGVVMSELLRRALTPATVVGEGPGGFPVVQPPAGARPLTVEQVREAWDDEL